MYSTCFKRGEKGKQSSRCERGGGWGAGGSPLGGGREGQVDRHWTDLYLRIYKDCLLMSSSCKRGIMKYSTGRAFLLPCWIAKVAQRQEGFLSDLRLGPFHVKL